MPESKKPVTQETTAVVLRALQISSLIIIAMGLYLFWGSQLRLIGLGVIAFGIADFFLAPLLLQRVVSRQNDQNTGSGF